MAEYKNNYAFTLVEMAIVIVIIGLLVGGVLQGQEMVQNARMTATIKQVQSYTGAVTGFLDKFGGQLPGDMANATKRIPGCTGACGNGNGNFKVGRYESELNQSDMGDPHPVGDERNEPTLFWKHLALSELVSDGVNPNAPLTPTQWGVTHPAAPGSGGFQIAYGTDMFTGFASTDHVLIVRSSPYGSVLGVGDSRGDQPFTHRQIERLSTKVDDGSADLGFVASYCVDIGEADPDRHDCAAVFPLFRARHRGDGDGGGSDS